MTLWTYTTLTDSADTCCLGRPGEPWSGSCKDRSPATRSSVLSKDFFAPLAILDLGQRASRSFPSGRGGIPFSRSPMTAAAMHRLSPTRSMRRNIRALKNPRVINPMPIAPGMSLRPLVLIAMRFSLLFQAHAPVASGAGLRVIDTSG